MLHLVPCIYSGAAPNNDIGPIEECRLTSSLFVAFCCGSRPNLEVIVVDFSLLWPCFFWARARFFLFLLLFFLLLHPNCSDMKISIRNQKSAVESRSHMMRTCTGSNGSCKWHLCKRHQASITIIATGHPWSYDILCVCVVLLVFLVFFLLLSSWVPFLLVRISIYDCKSIHDCKRLPMPHQYLELNMPFNQYETQSPTTRQFP